MKVTNAQELAEAINSGELNIEIEGTIKGSPSITLPEGATLTGGTLEFTAKGVRLTANNTLRDVVIKTTDYEVAIYNDTSLTDAGTFTLNNVTTVGQIYIVAEGNLKTARVEADQVTVAAADVRGRVEQPHGFGVDVLQGGFTLWNRNPDPESLFTATLKGINIGSEESPVRGSGLFVDGYTDREGKLTGGKFTADLIETGTVVTDGGIAPGTPDKITGGVFVLGGAIVEKVVNSGPVTTHGQNDMVLDLWGKTESWVANAPITSTGPSGIGFVNFGDMGNLEINAPVVTSGLGARGFNVYDGYVKSAKFQSITTHGDGAIGIQVSKPMGTIEVVEDVHTTGSEGLSLVKGVQMTLKAIGVSIKPGGELEGLSVGGNVITEADDLVSFEVLKGAKISKLSLVGIESRGKNSVASLVEGEILEGSADF